MIHSIHTRKAAPDPFAKALGDDLGVDLVYGDHTAQIRLHIVNDDTLDYVVTGDTALTAHVTLLPHLDAPLRAANARTTTPLKATSLAWDAATTGRQLDHGKVHLTLPPATSADWPVLPHNPYRKDGRAEPTEGRIVLSVPLDGQPKTFRLEIAP